jgi:surface antigen
MLVGISLIGAACATKSGTGAAVGAVGGGTVGAIVGGSTGALIGAALGGLAGYGVGRALEEEDRRQIAHALEVNERMRWENRETGYHYDVRPTGTYYDAGQPCRKFRMVADVEGRPEEVQGTACRNPDGNWEMIGT